MTKTTKIILWLIVAIIVIGGIWYGMTKKPTTEPEKEPIKIGFLGTLSGPNAFYGESMKKGVDLALNKINKDEQKIKVIYEDDQLSPEVAVTATRKLIDIDKVPAIVGVTGSSVMLAISPITERNKVVVITSTATADEISQAGDYIFRTITADGAKTKYFVDFIFNGLKKRKAAILYLETAATVAMKEIIEEEFPKMGGEIVAIESYRLEDKDLRTQLIKIKNKNPEVIFAVNYTRDLGLALKQAKELNINIHFVSPVETTEDPLVIEIAGSAAEGLIYIAPLEPVESFKEEFRERYGKNPPMYAAESYDAVMILSQVIDKYSAEPEKIKDGLYEIKNYHGASGTFSIDENGDVQKPFQIKTIKNGQFVLYEE